VLVRYNSAKQGFYHGNDIRKLRRVRFIGNVTPTKPWDCNKRVTYSHNVWDGARCGRTDVNAKSGFVRPARLDLHLKRGAAPVDRGDPSSFPTKDIDGEPRPKGKAPDAGADER
jgi:hypothetical protein